MPTADDLWNTPIGWPDNITDVPHAKDTYSARDWLIGASVNAARAKQEAIDAQTAVATLAGAVARIGSQVGALSDDEAKILAGLAGSEARLAAALLAEGSAVEAKLIEAIAAAPQAPGGGTDAAAVVAAFRDALARGTAS